MRNALPIRHRKQGIFVSCVAEFDLREWGGIRIIRSSPLLGTFVSLSGALTGMFTQPLGCYRRSFISACCCAMLLGTGLPAEGAQPPEKERNEVPRQRGPAERPPAERGNRERGDQSEPAGRGTPDGQPQTRVEPKLVPDPEGRIGRPQILPDRWYLGVYAYNTDEGVMITDVIPGSPAAQAGLEPRDLIVTVQGYQVGHVDGTLYNLGDELQNRADRRGRVLFLVQNWRNEKLTNLEVQLQHRGSYYRRER